MPKEIEFQFDRPDHSPGYLLGQATALWQRMHKRRLDPLDLTQTQFVLLAALGWLSKTSNAVTQVNIATQSNADRMMVSKVLRTLGDKGFITRQEHKDDTRAKVVRLTSRGEEVLQKAILEVEKADLEFFSVVGERLEGFTKTLLELLAKNQPQHVE